MTTEVTYDGVIWRKGKKTILRPVEEVDLPQFRRWVNDPENNRFILRIYPTAEADQRRWFERIHDERNQHVTVAITTHDGTLIGNMALRIDWINRTGSTGTIIGSKEHQGQGYGTDAKMQLLDFAFNWLQLRKVTSDVIAFNGRSLRYAEKCGYVEEGRLVKQIFREGQYHDEVILAVHREKWLPLWEAYNRE